VGALLCPPPQNRAADVHDEGDDASAQPARARDPARQQCRL